MKKQIALSVLLLIGIALAHAGNDLTLTYSQLRNSRVIRTTVNTDSIAYSFSVRQDRSGTFTLEAPPFLTADMDGRIRIGEIRDAGLFTLMISPMDNSAHSLGFNIGKNFQNISSPTSKPRMSGIVFSLDHIDLISLSPVFNPQSPLGFGVIAGNRNAFAGILLASQNEKNTASAAQKYQVNWEQLGTGRKMIFSLIGVAAETEICSFIIKGQLFVRNAWDLYLGGGTTCGWEIQADSDSVTLSGARKLGGTGVKLKRLTDDDSPMESLRLDAVISSCDKGKASMAIYYRSDTYRIPIYGGNSQKREMSYGVTVSFGAFSLKAENRMLYDIDRGKTASTDYSISMKETDLEILATFRLNRPDGQSPTAVDGELRITTPHAKLVVTGQKTTLQMIWERTVDDITFKASIDQDRLVTASLKLSGL